MLNCESTKYYENNLREVLFLLVDRAVLRVLVDLVALWVLVVLVVLVLLPFFITKLVLLCLLWVTNLVSRQNSYQYGFRHTKVVPEQ